MVFDREGAEITLGASINKASINRSVNPQDAIFIFSGNQL